ncbi:hypothetical protein F5X99DRAFT_385440 [Biscogniauxia marginata]|nr:hypothetical protein F5X99DRAFT_385440 [Biscogniauxia marginata]
MDEPIGPQARPKPKMSYACEACRAAKVKCQSGSQPGICKRCSEFKRECIFRTGPRTRRPKASSSRSDAQVPPPPPPGPSQTFSIDFSMPAAEEPRVDFDDLRQRHENFIEDLVPSYSSEEDDEYEDELGSFNSNAARENTFDFNDLSSGAIPTPSSTMSASSGKPGSAADSRRPMRNLGIKPQFNLDSATRLLSSFAAMLPHYPLMVLPADGDIDVRFMAKDAPFVLLAILAVTSCSSSLQGYSLYDEEFRKVLGLKFVAGGERSLELLQGLLIYCSWYPFHLRPKNRQMFQYLRMAVDIVRDLELDQESDMADLLSQDPRTRETNLQNIRAFLACYYSISACSWAWAKPLELRYTPWMAQCCEALEQLSDLDQDHTLVWLVRLQYILSELVEVQLNFKGFRDQQSEHHRQLICIGLETQLRDFQSRIPARLSTAPSIYMSSLTADMYLVAAPLMRPSRHSSPPAMSRSRAAASTDDDQPATAIDPAKLLATASTARAFLSYAGSLSRRQTSRFCGTDWARLIVAVILGFRLSFPVGPQCPGYDFVAGRRVLDFGERLREIMSAGEEGGEGGGKDRETDAVAAMRVVLGSVREKFERKSAALEINDAAAAEQRTQKAASRSCPMFDGSLDRYLPLWEGHQQQQQQGSYSLSTPYANSQISSGSNSITGSGITIDPGFTASGSGLRADLDHIGGAPIDAGAATAAAGFVGDKPTMVFHDLWATMTMGWAADTGELGLEGDHGFSDFADL